MNEAKPTYLLAMNSRTAKVVIHALDILARLGMGQLEIILDHLPEDGTPIADVCRHREQIRELMHQAKVVIGQHPNGSYGISNELVSEDAKIAYDTHCVLRREVAKIEKHGAHSVWHYEPSHLAKEPLAQVESMYLT